MYFTAIAALVSKTFEKLILTPSFEQFLYVCMFVFIKYSLIKVKNTLEVQRQGTNISPS